ADGSGEIDWPGLSEGRSRDAVSDSHDKVGAIVGHVDIEDVTTVEIDAGACQINVRSEEHTSELQSRFELVCRLLLEKKKTIVQALAIKDGKVLAVGTNQEIQGLAGARTEGVDLRGRTALPGLADIHAHLAYAARQAD